MDQIEFMLNEQENAHLYEDHETWFDVIVFTVPALIWMAYDRIKLWLT